MILISLLLALAFDRMFLRNRYWQSPVFVNFCLRKMGISGDDTQASRKIWLYLLIPAVLLGLTETYIFGGFLTFIVQTAVLFLALGCTNFRRIYKSWLQAAQREDREACDLYEKELHLGLLGKEDNEPEPDDGTRMQQLLLLANFRYYGAVMLFFIFFGAPGALFYMLVREAHHYYRGNHMEAALTTGQLLFALEWLPARAVTLGFLVVGHFSRATSVWLEKLTNVSEGTTAVLWSVARQAEIIEAGDSATCSRMAACAHVQAGVKLAKRNIIFILVITSVLTITGWVA